MVLNLGLLDWESSALTTKPLLHSWFRTDVCSFKAAFIYFTLFVISSSFWQQVVFLSHIKIIDEKYQKFYKNFSKLSGRSFRQIQLGNARLKDFQCRFAYSQKRFFKAL